MKRIGIITIVRVYNYGAELQAYALQKKLEMMGFEVEIIDYLFYKHKNHKASKLSKPWINIGFERKVKELLYPFNYSLKTFTKRKQQKTLRDKFESFHKKNTRFSKVQYSRLDELYSAHFIYDIFMVGSDQVWNPWSNTSLDPYFLTFAPEGKKRISYASSFGVSELPKESLDKFTDCLNKLDSISVREFQGVEIVQKLTSKVAQHVLDPTLLLTSDEWEKLALHPEFSEKYILLYLLTNSSYAKEFAEKLSQETGYCIVELCRVPCKNNNKSIINITNAGPAEFLGWFFNASLIITNSFHGTAFSINFNRPFFSIIHVHKINTSRQSSLLKLLKLNSRILKEGEAFPNNISLNIDFTEANSILKTQRCVSTDFLAKAIN